MRLKLLLLPTALLSIVGLAYLAGGSSPPKIVTQESSDTPLRNLHQQQHAAAIEQHSNTEQGHDSAWDPVLVDVKPRESKLLASSEEKQETNQLIGDETVVTLSDLESTDENIRLKALNRSMTQDIKLPVDSVRKLVTGDPSATVRAMAISAIAQDQSLAAHEKESIIAAAQSDTDPRVKIVLEDLRLSLAMQQHAGEQSEETQE